MFDDLLGKAIPLSIVKPDGTRVDATGHVSAKTVYMTDLRIPVAGGDIIEHALPSGAVQVSDVVQAVAYEIPEPHLQVKIRPQRSRPAARNAAGMTVTITNSVVEGAIQVGHDNHAKIALTRVAPGHGPATPLEEVRDELLAVLDQAIASRRLLIDAGEDLAAIRSGIDVILGRIQQLAGDTQMSREAMRGVAELATSQVQDQLSSSLRTFFVSHKTPVLQNLFASVVFEAAKAALGA